MLSNLLHIRSVLADDFRVPGPVTPTAALAGPGARAESGLAARRGAGGPRRPVAPLAIEGGG